MVTESVFRVVLASPSDVQAERDAAGLVINSLNRMLRSSGFSASLRLVRWETDAYPALHDRGPRRHYGARVRNGKRERTASTKSCGSPALDPL